MSAASKGKVPSPPKSASAPAGSSSSSKQPLHPASPAAPAKTSYASIATASAATLPPSAGAAVLDGSSLTPAPTSVPSTNDAFTRFRINVEDPTSAAYYVTLAYMCEVPDHLLFPSRFRGMLRDAYFFIRDSCRVAFPKDSVGEHNEWLHHWLSHVDFVRLPPVLLPSPKGILLCGGICINTKRTHALLVRGRAPGAWSFPKGKINEGETPLECARREVYEEVNHWSDLSDIVHQPVADSSMKLYIMLNVPMDNIRPNCTGEVFAHAWVHLRSTPGQLEHKLQASSQLARTLSRKLHMVCTLLGLRFKSEKVKGATAITITELGGVAAAQPLPPVAEPVVSAAASAPKSASAKKKATKAAASTASAATAAAGAPDSNVVSKPASKKKKASVAAAAAAAAAASAPSASQGTTKGGVSVLPASGVAGADVPSVAATVAAATSSPAPAASRQTDSAGALPVPAATPIKILARPPKAAAAVASSGMRAGDEVLTSRTSTSDSKGMVMPTIPSSRTRKTGMPSALPPSRPLARRPRAFSVEKAVDSVASLEYNFSPLPLPRSQQFTAAVTAAAAAARSAQASGSVSARDRTDSVSVLVEAALAASSTSMPALDAALPSPALDVDEAALLLTPVDATTFSTPFTLCMAPVLSAMAITVA